MKNNVRIEEIPFDQGQEKQQAVRVVLEDLPDWFGIPESTNAYIENAAGQIVFQAGIDGQTAGILALKQTSPVCMEVEVMGVRPSLHQQGIGKSLMQAAISFCKKAGVHYLQVKTVAMGHYPQYDATNRFYLAMGFEPIEIFETLWDPGNPCQQYLLAVK